MSRPLAVPAFPASRRGNACAALTDAEYADLQQLAAQYVAARGGFTTFMEWTGRYAERGLAFLPRDWRDTLHSRAREGLSWAWRHASTGMDPDAPDQPAPDQRSPYQRGWGQRKPRRRTSPRTYRLMTAGSGALTGAAGLPGVLIDLPTSTLLVLRSLAAMARDKGLAVADADVQAACLEAFAYGGPTDEDDDADLAFWSTRAAVPVLAEMIPQVAARLSGRLALMLPARAVPLISVAAGAGVNWHFTGFFQRMGNVLLTLLPLERRYGRAQVRACFESLVREARSAAAMRR